MISNLRVVSRPYYCRSEVDLVPKKVIRSANNEVIKREG